MNSYYFPLKLGGLGDKFMILSDILTHREKFNDESMLHLITNKYNHSFVVNILNVNSLIDFFHFKRPNFDLSISFLVDDKMDDLNIIHKLNAKNDKFVDVQIDRLENGNYWPIDFVRECDDDFCWMLYIEGKKNIMPEKRLTKKDYEKFNFMIKTKKLNGYKLFDFNFSENVKILAKSKFLFACEGMWTHLSRAMKIPTIAFSRNPDWIREINQQGHFCSSDFEECLFELRHRCINTMK